MRRLGMARAALAAAVVSGIAAAAAGPAQAAFTFTVVQQGSDVVVTGSGTVDLTGLTSSTSGTVNAGLNPGLAALSAGTTAMATNYFGITGPSSFGGLAAIFPSSSSGSIVRLVGAVNAITLPQGYVSGDPLSNTATFAGSTFASLSMTPGTYTWTWGSGQNTDSLTVQIGPVTVPEPASAAILGAGLLGLAAAGRRRKGTPRG